MIPVLFLISLIVFMIMHALPGDPAQLMLAGAESGSVTPERLEELREQMRGGFGRGGDRGGRGPGGRGGDEGGGRPRRPAT